MNCCFNANVIRVCKTLNISDHIVNFFAFRPPQISIFLLIKKHIKSIYWSKISEKVYPRTFKKLILYMRFIPTYSSLGSLLSVMSCINTYPKRLSLSYTLLIKSKWAFNVSKDKNSPVLLFSHGNSCDLGTIYPMLIDISTQLKVIILSKSDGYHRIWLLWLWRESRIPQWDHYLWWYRKGR